MEAPDASTAQLEEIADPLERYRRATAAQAHHEAVALTLTRVRERAVAQMHQGGLSYRRIASLLELSPARVQQLVERAREHDQPKG